MCGFVAQFSRQGTAPDPVLVRRMAGEIIHRGPDDEGYHFGNWFGLGFRRLSILDTSHSGHQPMLDEHRRYAIVYNGELYNYKLLRRQLIERGYRFFSETDTEVVLKSYVQWGAGCLDRFVGMFAFIIVDLHGNRVIAARDQLGIKPLYIYEGKETLLFASEIKCFRHYRDHELNHDALYEQFFFRYVAGKETIFKDIHRLDAGTYMTFSKNAAPVYNHYYDISDSLVHAAGKTLDYRHIEAELKQSILLHTQSDVGYNVQLSGGLDSSYITAVLADDYQQHLNTYSVSLKDKEMDESSYQQQVATQYQTKHHDYTLNAKDLADNFPRATWHMDMPIVHINCVFLMCLCGHARERSKVILTGEGADELFGGYQRYSIPLKYQAAFWLKRAGLKPGLLPDFSRLKGLNALLSTEFGVEEQSMFKDSRRFELFRNLGSLHEYRQSVAGRFPDLLRKIIASDQKCYLATLLERQDKMGMAMSVESRVPFCLPGLFDLVNTYNPHLKITPVKKIILKKLASNYFDKDFIYRPKGGFRLPLPEWLRDKKTLGRYLDLLTDVTFSQRGFYNVAAVQQAIKEHLAGVADRSQALIRLIGFEIWHRQFIDRKAV